MKDPTKKSRSISAVASSSVDGVDNCGLCFTEVGKTAPGGMGAFVAVRMEASIALIRVCVRCAEAAADDTVRQLLFRRVTSSMGRGCWHYKPIDLKRVRGGGDDASSLH